jgi:tryptophan synthase alpha chain
MIVDAFERAGKVSRAAFVPYVMAGDPDLETSEQILLALRDEGADLIELGVPFGDPLADGPTIAAAGQRALAGGVRLADVIALARRASDAGGPPIVLFAYFNTVLQYGIERFARDSSAAKIAGTIVPDAALEEIGPLRDALTAHGLDMPLLVAPSTSRERAGRIAAAATGFVYVVSRLGVTGAASVPNLDPLREQLEMLRAATQKPLAVGFGISTRDQVRAVAALADGVVVGSALIDAYAGRKGSAARNAVAAFVNPMIAACRKDVRSGCNLSR